MFISITFDFGNLWSFLIGIFFGVSLFSLIYLFQILINIKKGFKGRKPKDVIEKDEVIYLINEAKEKFNDKELRQNNSQLTHLTHICKDLVNDIAMVFYPKSKYPIYELTIDESLLLVKYISDRVNEILDRRGIRTIKKITIAKILGWASVKKNFDESKLVQISSKYKFKQIVKTTMGIINLVNPIYWTKKLVISTSTNLVIKKICIITISIVGEETYKIYSKKVFDKEDELDSGVKEIENEMDEVIKDIKDEDIASLNELEILSEGDELDALEKKEERKSKSKKSKRGKLFRRGVRDSSD